MKKHTSKDERVELCTNDLRHAHKIYLEGEKVGEVTLGIDNTMGISFDEDWLFKPETLQVIIETINKAQRDISERTKHLQTLKGYNLWRRGYGNKSMPASVDITSAIQWAIENLENDDI